MSDITLEVSAPLAAFRPYTARDYQETLPAPPPATIFGMILSAAGIEAEARGRFVGAECAVAIEQRPPVSKVLRKMHRGSETDEVSGQEAAKHRPEYQELLSSLRFWTRIVDESAHENPGLADCIRRALESPSSIDRFGAVSLGESTFIVDELSIVESVPDDVLVLRPSDDGFLAMSVWVDFEDRSRTRLKRFELEEGRLGEEDLVTIGPNSTR